MKQRDAGFAFVATALLIFGAYGVFIRSIDFSAQFILLFFSIFAAIGKKMR